MVGAGLLVRLWCHPRDVAGVQVSRTVHHYHQDVVVHTIASRALDERRREILRRDYERKFRSVAPSSHEEAPLFVKAEPDNGDLFNRGGK